MQRQHGSSQGHIGGKQVNRQHPGPQLGLVLSQRGSPCGRCSTLCSPCTGSAWPPGADPGFGGGTSGRSRKRDTRAGPASGWRPAIVRRISRREKSGIIQARVMSEPAAGPPHTAPSGVPQGNPGSLQTSSLSDVTKTLGIRLHTGLLQTAGVERMVENLPISPGSG